MRSLFTFLFFLMVLYSSAQLPLARDTITVIENNYVLKMPWANGINYANASGLDVNGDNIQDLVIYDKSNQYAQGRFRCFVNTGTVGTISYRVISDATYYFPTVKNWAVFHDYNGDGKADLFCSTDLGIKVYKNTSSASQLNFTLAKAVLYSDYNPGGAPLKLNLYASSIAVPGFSDIDNDGDLDILSFAPQGIFVEYHKNLSMELYQNKDSLVFARASDCWGKVSESNCSVDFGLCTGNKESGIITSTLTENSTQQKPYHAGSCLTCFDSDGDGDKDLIMGDVACNNVQFVHNNGSASNALFNDTTKMYPNYPNKNSTKQIIINNYPCTYFVDVDKDGRSDLMASPNVNNSENYKSLWLYRNVSNTNQVNFQFVKENFLQDEMIEVGQNSFPVLFDYNADGKKDLLIGNHGYYVNNNLQSRLTLYENIGSTAQPIFKLVSRDYASLSNQFLNNVMPAVGDIDGDGDVDILIGTSSGQIHWLKNAAGANNVANFSVFLNNPFAFTTNSGSAAPNLFDIDGDGKLDLLIGTRNGKIAYYNNTGTATIPSFSLITNNLGNIDVTTDPLLVGFSFATPFFYSESGAIKALVGSISGQIFHYNVPNNLNSAFSMISSNANALSEGPNSTVWYEDINNDGKRDLFIGNASGGLSFFSSASPFVEIQDKTSITNQIRINTFPNPVSNEINIQINAPFTTFSEVCLTNIVGEKLICKKSDVNLQSINMEKIPMGIYFLNVTIHNGEQQYYFSKKIVKQ